MSISELYEIGKRSRNPLAGVKKRSEGRGRQLVTLLDEAEGSNRNFQGSQSNSATDSVNEDDEGKRLQDEQTGVKVAAVRDISGPSCLICRLKASKYNCPTCNIPYCSLDCFQSISHASCSQPFLQKTLQSELGRNGQGGGGMVEEGERKAMMDVLRRMNKLGDDDNDDNDHLRDSADDMREGLENDENDEVEQNNEVNLEDASVEQLLSLLSADERDRFRAAVEDQDPGQGRARSILDKLMQQQSLATSNPWWEDNFKSFKRRNDRFLMSTSKLAEQSLSAKAAKIEYNIVAVLLAYVFIVRHLELGHLGELKEASAIMNQPESDDMPPLESVDEEIYNTAASSTSSPTIEVSKEEEKTVLRTIVENKMKQFLPFLSVSGDTCKIVLESVEDVSIWTVGKMDSDAALKPAQTLSFLYKDVKAIIEQPRLVDMSSPPTDNVILALSDLQHFLPTPSQRKVIFYGSYWLRLSKARKEDIMAEVDVEIKRLQAELDRADDEERFRAANEVIEQQNVIVSS